MGERKPEDEHAVAKALRAALRTRRHADTLFNTCAADLGDAAREHTLAEGKVRWLYRRDGALVVPWPLLTLSRVERKLLNMDLGLGPPIEVTPRDEKAPAMRDMGPGHIRLHEGAHHVEVAYRKDGLWLETIRNGPPETLAGVLDATASEDCNPTEAIAAFVCGEDPGRHGPGRLVEHDPFPDGPTAGWTRGLQAMRLGLHEKKVSDAEGWLVADPFGGPAAHFASEEEALAGWQVAAVTQLGPCTLPEHPWGSWARLLGPHGESHFALQRFHPNGFTLVGSDALEHIDLDTLEAALDRADESVPEWPVDESEAWKGEAPTYLCRSVRYRVEVDAATGQATLHWEQARRGHRSEAATLLDGAILRSMVFRQLWG